MKQKNSAPPALAERLKTLTDRGISKSEMARIADVTPQSVYAWFKKGVISKKSAIALAAATGVSVSWLLGEEVDESSGLKPQETRILELFRQLPTDDERSKIIMLTEMRLKELDDFVEKYLKGRLKQDDK